jgi:Zn-dependent protease with chaperone function
MLCPEVAFFAGALVVLVAFTGLPRLIREQRALRPSSSPRAHAARARVLELIERHEDLVWLSRRLVVTEGSSEPIVTLGVFTPRIVIHSSFVRDLDDAALLGALRHEAEHVRHRDPLRYFISWWALAANRIGRHLLRSEFTRWIVARETHCDREAVLAGASGPALAQALVTAARFPTDVAPTTALRAPNASVLRLRIGLLMAYAEHPPKHCCRAPALRFVVGTLLLAIALPHQFGADAIDTLHRVAEGAASALIQAQE